MAHNTLNGGAVTEIGGGKAMLGGTVYEVDSGKALSGGTVYPIKFADECTVEINLSVDNQSMGVLGLGVGVYDNNGNLVDGYLISTVQDPSDDSDDYSEPTELSEYHRSYFDGTTNGGTLSAVMTVQKGYTLKLFVCMDGKTSSYCYIYYNGTQVYAKDTDIDYDTWSTEITGNTTVVSEEWSKNVSDVTQYNTNVNITMEG